MERLEQLSFPVIRLTHKTPVPIKNLYKTPETLGADRLAAVIGAIIYYVVISLVLRMGLESTDLKLLTALVVAVFLTVPYLSGKRIAKARK